jgi:hypothetical protein
LREIQKKNRERSGTPGVANEISSSFVDLRKPDSTLGIEAIAEAQSELFFGTDFHVMRIFTRNAINVRLISSVK